MKHYFKMCFSDIGFTIVISYLTRVRKNNDHVMVDILDYYVMQLPYEVQTPSSKYQRLP